MDDILRVANAVAWVICMACLFPAVLRLIRGRGRYQDPIWSIVFLLALNRLAFLSRVSSEASHLTALILAVVMSCFSVWYQRHDA